MASIVHNENNIIIPFALGVWVISLIVIISGHLSKMDFGVIGIIAWILFIIGIIYFTSKHKGWFIPKEKLTKNQTIAISISGFIFSIGSLWVAIIANLHFILKLVLLGGFLFFGIGPIVLLRNLQKKRR